MDENEGPDLFDAALVSAMLDCFPGLPHYREHRNKMAAVMRKLGYTRAADHRPDGVRFQPPDANTSPNRVRLAEAWHPDFPEMKTWWQQTGPYNMCGVWYVREDARAADPGSSQEQSVTGGVAENVRGMDSPERIWACPQIKRDTWGIEDDPLTPDWTEGYWDLMQDGTPFEVPYVSAAAADARVAAARAEGREQAAAHLISLSREMLKTAADPYMSNDEASRYEAKSDALEAAADEIRALEDPAL